MRSLCLVLLARPCRAVPGYSCAASPVGAAVTYGGVACSACAAGTFASAAGSAACDPCPAGSFCPAGAAAPTPCPAGTWSNAASLASAAQCTAVHPGYYAPLGSAVPVACPPSGFYCPGATFDTVNEVPGALPIPLLPGDAAASGDRDDVSAHSCARGHWCSAGMIIACEIGFFNPERGAASAAACLRCPVHSSTNATGSVALEDCTCDGGFIDTSTAGGGLTCAPVGSPPPPASGTGCAATGTHSTAVLIGAAVGGAVGGGALVAVILGCRARARGRGSSGSANDQRREASKV